MMELFLDSGSDESRAGVSLVMMERFEEFCHIVEKKEKCDMFTQSE